jgi:hypothetical protein
MAGRDDRRAIPVEALGRDRPVPACICAQASVMLNGVDDNARENAHEEAP